MKPAGPVFDSVWRSECRIAACSIASVDAFIAAHYLKKRPAIVTLCLAASRGAFDFGCIVFSMPPPETAKRYGGVTWELARLYLLDEIPANAETWLIGQAVRYIRRYCSGVKALVSYADPSVGHAGTIYKAANWTPDGRTDDERKTPRCDYVDAAGKKYGRRSHVPEGTAIQRVPRVSKWRFFLTLHAA